MNDSVGVPDSSSELKHWLDYWARVHTTGIDLGLERVLPVAEAMGLLQPQAEIITVGGTNGKGSVSTVIASIYHHADYRVGLYQSPHIYRFNERIRINGSEVDDRQLIDAFVAVQAARLKCGLSLSFFEATSLAAFHLFKQAQCDVWVLEVGLGGRLDVVNIIDPDVAIITNISYDHVDWLGDTIEQIAYEKAGIMRANIPVIYAGDLPPPKPILEQAAKLNCKLHIAQQDYLWSSTVEQQGKTQHLLFSTAAISFELSDIQLAPVNVATAVMSVLSAELPLQQSAVIKGVERATIQGRFQYIQYNNRSVILDVAHNIDSANFLKQQLLQSKPDFCSRIHMVFSILADKDVPGVISVFSDIVDQWYIAPLFVDRAAPIEQIEMALQQFEFESLENILSALDRAVVNSDSQDLIIVCGSFYTLEAVWESLAACQ